MGLGSFLNPAKSHKKVAGAIKKVVVKTNPPLGGGGGGIPSKVGRVGGAGQITSRPGVVPPGQSRMPGRMGRDSMNGGGMRRGGGPSGVDPRLAEGGKVKKKK